MLLLRSLSRLLLELCDRILRVLVLVAIRFYLHSAQSAHIPLHPPRASVTYNALTITRKCIIPLAPALLRLLHLLLLDLVYLFCSALIVCEERKLAPPYESIGVHSRTKL